MLVRLGRSDEALKAIDSIGINDNEPLAFAAVALAESGRLDEARQAAAEAFASASNFENVIIRSGALLELVRATRNAGRADEALKFVAISCDKLAAIKNQSFKSDSHRLVAEALALLKQWAAAIETAERCEQQIDRMAAYTAIVREYSISQNPSLAQVFRQGVD